MIDEEEADHSGAFAAKWLVSTEQRLSALPEYRQSRDVRAAL
jgi:hypothetical protein